MENTLSKQLQLLPLYQRQHTLLSGILIVSMMLSGCGSSCLGGITCRSCCLSLWFSSYVSEAEGVPHTSLLTYSCTYAAHSSLLYQFILSDISVCMIIVKFHSFLILSPVMTVCIEFSQVKCINSRLLLCIELEVCFFGSGPITISPQSRTVLLSQCFCIHCTLVIGVLAGCLWPLVCSCLNLLLHMGERRCSSLAALLTDQGWSGVGYYSRLSGRVIWIVLYIPGK